MKKTMLTSRQGLTRCPACLSHVQVSGGLEGVACPFCGAGLVEARRADQGTFGAEVKRVFGASGSGQLAAALGISLAMSACDGTEVADPEPKPATTEAAPTPAPVDVVPAPVPNEVPSADVYGGPPVRPVEAIPVVPEPVEVVPAPVPAEVPTAAIYGGPPVDGGPAIIVPPAPVEPEVVPAPAPAREIPKPVYGGPSLIRPPAKPKPE